MGRATFASEFLIPLAVLVLLACLLYHIQVGPVVAFLAAGVAAGPYGLGLVQNDGLIHGLVETGAVILFFLAGTRFSIEHLERSRFLLRVVGLQVSLIVAVTCLLLIVFGVNWQASLYTGLLASLGSPALVSALPDTHFSLFKRLARLTLPPVLLCQSMLVVFMLLLVPVLAGVEEAVLGFARALLVMVAFIALSLILAHMLVPQWLERAMQKNGREGVLAVVLILCASVLLVVGIMGLGLAIAAFLAGFTLSGCRHRGRPISEVFPLQPIASALFLVSLGMMLDVHFLTEHWLLVLAVAGSLFLIKLLISHGSATHFGIPAGISAPAALMTVPVGELAFLLFYDGRAVGLTPADLGMPGEQAFVAVSVLLLVAVSLFVRAESVLRVLECWIDVVGPCSAQGVRLDQPPVQQTILDFLSRKSFRNRSEASETACTLSGSCSNARDCDRVHTGFFPILSRFNENGPCVRVMTVQPGAPASGFPIGRLDLWQRLGVFVLGLWRQDLYLVDPPETYRLQTGDHVVLSGWPDRLAQSAPLFQGMASSAPPDTDS